MEQGRLAACHAFGDPRARRPRDHFPYGIYTIPEISIVGKNEEELTEAGVPYEVGRARLPGDRARPDHGRHEPAC